MRDLGGGTGEMKIRDLVDSDSVFGTDRPSRIDHDAEHQLIDANPRQTALLQKVPYYTTLPGILAVTKAIAAEREDRLDVKPLQAYF